MIAKSFEPYAYAVIRIVFGFLFLPYGLQKLFGMFGAPMAHYPDGRFFAALIETTGAPLIMLGLFTRPVAFLLSGEMACAYFVQHFPRGWLPVQNKGELAVLFCFAFLYISTQGPGIWSIDTLRRRRTSRGTAATVAR
jgi:putative oxidoreductase